MFAYRIEHKKSGMGPFEHRHNGDQLSECMQLAYHKDPSDMIDAKTFRKMCKQQWIYGWTSRKLFDKFCSNKLKRKLIDLGFVIKRYNVKTNCYIFIDNQIAFERTNSFRTLKSVRLL